MTEETGDSFVDVAGGQIFVRRWRAVHREKAPLVLLHDSLGCVDQWRDFPAALASATNRDVVAYDRLGFGRSTPRTGRPSAQFVSEEGATVFPAIRRALELTRFALFGHSVGGAMALVIAAAHGDGCEAVITEAAQAFVEARTLSAIRAARVQFEDPEQLARIARWHGAKARWVLDAWTEVWLSPEFSSWSLDAHLAEVSCPVLAIHGDLDEFGSLEFPRRIASRTRGPSELAILEHCGHAPHRERSEEVLRLAASFLERHGPNAALRRGLTAKPGRPN